MESSVRNRSSEFTVEIPSPEDPSIRSTRTPSIRSLSFGSLKELPLSAFETDPEAVNSILTHKKDIWKNPQLLELVKHYFENSSHMLDFCTALDECLKRARYKQLIISAALQRFEEEEIKNDECYSKTLEELNRFKIAEGPFSEDLFPILKTVREQQLSMLENSRLGNSKTSMKLKYRETWRNRFTIILWIAFAVFFIIAVAAAAARRSYLNSILAAAAAYPSPIAKRCGSLWRRYLEVPLEGQRELFRSMVAQAFMAVSYLDNVKALADRLEIHIESLANVADFALRGEDMVKFGVEDIKIGMEDIKKKMERFMQSLNDLGDHASKCVEQRTEGRRVILQKMIK